MIRFLYNVGTTIAGFLTHPYQTMQKVTSAQIPIAFVFFPGVLCVIGWVVALKLSWLFLDLLPFVGLWWFLEVWWLTFWGMWQVTLLYLYWRFTS